MTNYKPRYTTRWQRWKIAFEDGRGPLFWMVAVVGAIGAYAALWLVLAIGLMLEL